ncbi:beta-1,3-galactosyl-O-glycosyl-glycoprotein beta-1,6-N-acetylglucosaminyltransferase-like [Chiloscyllium punctatum]|uniref:beta-1,3-galactosyl-O-glycosyl-glycoprotein beta-1,6-N-acetylglucosaminyltransferase-like n=1 Tax=Chiloscyllium punctatum TaxID=137246 RepID=UPI003B633ADF
MNKPLYFGNGNGGKGIEEAAADFKAKILRSRSFPLLHSGDTGPGTAGEKQRPGKETPVARQADRSEGSPDSERETTEHWLGWGHCPLESAVPKLSQRCTRWSCLRAALCVLSVVLLCQWLLVQRGGGRRLTLRLVKPGASPMQEHLLLVEENSTCWQIIQGDRQEVERALLNSITVSLKHQAVTEVDYLNMTRNCRSFVRARKYITVPLSPEEEHFPLAYSMVIHQSIEMFERLLRSIDTPQNIYCIHVDRKSPSQFHAAVRAIASCFHNVFVAAKLEWVTYAGWSRVQADLNCMKELLESPVPWRYFINVCGQDFPLKTNREIIRSLRALNGSNVIESDPAPGFKKSEFSSTPPPHPTSIFVGSAYFMASREFVGHVFDSAEIQAFLKWSEDTYSPDEHVWATLHRMPNVPGSIPSTQAATRTLGRAVKWSFEAGDVARGALYPPCTGRYRHLVCVYGAGDLHWVVRQRCFFANKFDPNMDNTAVQVHGGISPKQDTW